MDEIKRLIGAIAAYSRSDDPLASATNLIALCVVGNQPFYPLYVWWVVGDDGYASFLTFLSTPFFLAIPAVARRSSLAGRAMLPIVGVANTVLSIKAFGYDSGVALFLGPCAMIAGMALRASERSALLATLGLAFAALALHDWLGAPVHLFSAEAYRRFVSLNAWSVAGLTAFTALQFSGALAESARRRER
jgi:hypothetical protein